jgi:hypothetical protein
VEPGFGRAVFVAGGRIAAVRSIPHGGGRTEVEAGLAAARMSEASLAAEDSDELRIVSQFLRRPPPELTVCRLDAAQILAACTERRAVA